MKSFSHDTAVAGNVAIEFLGTTIEMPLTVMVPPASGPPPWLRLGQGSCCEVC